MFGSGLGGAVRRWVLKLLVGAALSLLQLATAAPAWDAPVNFARFSERSQISAEGLALIKRFEGLRLCPYDDARPHARLRPGDRVHGVLTVGYGHTGPDVQIGRCVSEAEAEALLRADLAAAERAVARLAPAGLAPHVRAALISFTYNAGAGAFERSTLLKLLNRGEIRAAADELPKWVWGVVSGEKVRLAGLVRRRAAERALMLGQGL